MKSRVLKILGLVLLLAILAAAGNYAYRLKRRAQENQQRLADNRPVVPPVAGPTEHVTLYVAFDEQGMLLKHDAEVSLPPERSERARQVLRALLALYLDTSSPHPIGPGADIKDVYLLDNGLAVIDTNAEFAEGHRSGILVEELTVASLVETLGANIPGVSRVKILVDGKERETLAGHADLYAIYDVGLMAQLRKDAQ